MPGYMRMTRLPTGLACALALTMTAVTVASVQQPAAPQFGGGYAELDARRQALVNDWVARLVKTTGQQVDPGPFYDDLMTTSSKTTFDAVTHALLRIQLTDAAGAALGDALGLVGQVEAVKGEVIGAAGDHQFRMYVRLVPGAGETLARSQQFKRGADNSVFHKGYPTNFREQGGVPSVQVSIALDGRRADIDVDYRASSFPSALFNGHLTSSNSDVRAGNNYDRHISRWTGFQKWWGGFFGVHQTRTDGADSSSRQSAIPTKPRIGKKDIDAMVYDFLRAWLVEGDIVNSMAYVSKRSFACLARNSDSSADFDYGLAPVQLMIDMKATRDVLGPRTSLATVIAGATLANPALRVVRQPHQAEFVVYSVPEDVAAAFDCESQLSLGDPKVVKRKYGTYFGSTFMLAGRPDVRVALLWAKEQDYWKIVSWKVGTDNDRAPAVEPVATAVPARIAADPTLVQAARGFLESWLVKKNYDVAFAYLSPKAYACYDLERDPASAASTSPEDAGRRLRSGLEVAGRLVTARSLEAMLSAPEPLHPAVKVMDHPLARVFGLTSLPNALADAAECGARASGRPVPDAMPLEYGAGFGMNIRFNTRSGDTPVMRMLWRQENGAWRITSYAVELP